MQTDGRRHAVKYMEASVFGRELAAFWGDYGDYEYPEDESQEGWDTFFAWKRSEATASRQAGQRREDGRVLLRPGRGRRDRPLPGYIDTEAISEDLQTAAQVVEMLLIEDHSRMKLEASTPHDSTREQQHRLLSISHPEDWAAASQEFRDGDYLKGTEA